VKILAIETSCDETAASIVENGKTILSSIIASSAEMHAETGGIIPERAARQQVRSIIPVIEAAISKSGVRPKDISAVAVTSGPGLIGSLLVGIEAARTLCLIWEKPIVPVNHLVAHIYANWLEQEVPPLFPALALVVSGGHTDLVLMHNHSGIEWVGGTRDDAAGEAFDKTARLLGLPYPGGPSLSKEAAKYNDNNLKLFPRPMIDEDNFDWSFSGLKTAVARNIASSKKLSVPKIAAEVQEAIVDVLIAKTLGAAALYKPKSLLLAGGVAANSRLREKFAQQIKKAQLEIELRVPPANLCTDNAAYIAACAYFNYFPVDWTQISAKPELTILGQL
jgi:N6-L-threonylcarbamoyladenine synthase